MPAPRNTHVRLAVDFDGTLVEHRFPHIGTPVPFSVDVLQNLADNYGFELILWTMRSGDTLQEAVDYCIGAGIKLSHVNATGDLWTESPKVYAKYYVDDAAVGCPLIYPPAGRPYVDWLRVQQIILDQERCTHGK